MEIFIAVMLILLLAVSSLTYLSIAYTFTWFKTKLATGFLVSQDYVDSQCEQGVDEDPGDDEDGERRKAYL